MHLISIISYLFWPLLIVWFIFSRTRKKDLRPGEAYLQAALSREDMLSQFFLLLGFFFLGLTMVAFNRDLGDPISRRTLLLVISLLGLLITYGLKALYPLPFSLIGLPLWWSLEAADWMDLKNVRGASMLFGLVIIGLILYALGHLLEKERKWKRFSLVHSMMGIIWTSGTLAYLSTKSGLHSMAGLTKGAPFTASVEITVSLLIFTAALAGTSFYSFRGKLISRYELYGITILTLLFTIVLFLPQQTMFNEEVKNSFDVYSGYYTLSGNGTVLAIIFNLAIFLQLLGLIFSGYLRREVWLINLGTVLLFILITIRYFDWFFTFLNKSIFFIGAGLLLMGVGWLMEKRRKAIIADIGEEEKVG